MVAISSTYPPSTPIASSQKLWTEKWRPRRAEDVLGNENNGLYLRDWLKALALQFGNILTSSNLQTSHSIVNAPKVKKYATQAGNKRPRIIRDIKTNRKKRKTGRNWIVDSDESEEDTVFQFDDPYSVLYSDTASDDPPSLGPQAPPPGTFQNSVYNTILLTGPPGCGKTAAVYACAEELGWEVFEIYPGIGKRNGNSIEQLVGEMGKNHLVRRAQPRGYEDMGQNGKQKYSSQCQDDDNPELIPSTTGDPSVNQSIVLLEEVDILFKEDTSFWPAVVNFIKQCKRPVVCTCNGNHSIYCDFSLFTLYLQIPPSYRLRTFLFNAPSSFDPLQCQLPFHICKPFVRRKAICLIAIFSCKRYKI